MQHFRGYVPIVLTLGALICAACGSPKYEAGWLEDEFALNSEMTGCRQISSVESVADDLKQYGDQMIEWMAWVPPEAECRFSTSGVEAALECTMKADSSFYWKNSCDAKGGCPGPYLPENRPISVGVADVSVRMNWHGVSCRPIAP